MKIIPVPQPEIRIATPLVSGRRSYVQIGPVGGIVDAIARDCAVGAELDAVLLEALAFCAALDEGMVGTVVLLPDA